VATSASYTIGVGTGLEPARPGRGCSGGRISLLFL